MRTVRFIISFPGHVTEGGERSRDFVVSPRRRSANRLTIGPIHREDLPVSADMHPPRGLFTTASDD